MILKNIDAFVVEDDENQTMHLKCRDNQWWYGMAARMRPMPTTSSSCRDQSQGCEAVAAGQGSLNNRSTRPTGTAHAHRSLHRSAGRLHDRQQRAAGHDRGGLAGRQEAQGSEDRLDQPIHLRQSPWSCWAMPSRMASTRSRSRGRGRAGLLQRLLTNSRWRTSSRGRSGGVGQPQVRQADQGREERRGAWRSWPGASTRRWRSTSGPS